MNTNDLKDMTLDELRGFIRFYDGAIEHARKHNSHTDYIEFSKHRDAYAAELKRRTIHSEYIGNIEAVVYSDASFDKVLVGTFNINS